jgi:hypothetical protein
MGNHSSFDNGKAQSLVFSFAEQLRSGDDFDAPEPSFLNWMDKSLSLDVLIAGDEADCEKPPEEEPEAWGLFCKALEATGNLLDLYKRNLPLFQKVSKQLRLLPCFMSWHPDNRRFNRDLLNASQLGRQDMDGAVRPQPQHLAQQSSPVRYAYAIMATIDLTLDGYADELPFLAVVYDYGVKHPIPLSELEPAMKLLGWDEERKRRELPKYEGRYRILPAWTKTLGNLRRPFNADHVLDYWRTGKEMILEEMPDFHLQPEWKDYHHRRYKSGAKDGAIQHAIFKDILAALRTIAGAGKKKSAKVSPKS